MFRTFAKHFDANFNDAFQYPVVVFYESADVKETDKQRLRSLTRSTLFFQRVEFRLPPFINESLISKHCRGGLKAFGLGYRHMCRFHSLSIYDEPILQLADGIDYLWRLDDDSVLTKPIGFDVFRFKRDRSLRYGYVLAVYDDPACKMQFVANATRNL